MILSSKTSNRSAYIDDTVWDLEVNVANAKKYIQRHITFDSGYYWCITVTKDTDIPNTKGLYTVGSLWHVPLPLESSKNSRVVVYFYNDRWFPITFYTLADAIALHHQAVKEGRELVVFPPGLDPRTFDVSTQPVPVLPKPQLDNCSKGATGSLVSYP